MPSPATEPSKHQRPLRILHVITGLRSGGAETMLCKILEAAPPGEWDSRVLSLEGSGFMDGRVRGLGVPLQTLGLRQGDRLSQARRGLGATFTEDWRPDVIQGWMYHGNLAAWVLSRCFPGATLLWNIRQTLYGLHLEKGASALVIRANALLSGGVAGIVCNSRLSAAQHQAAGFSRRAWRIIPNGFDLRTFSDEPQRRSEMRAALGISEGTFLIGQIARVHPMKDHANAIRAVALALKTAPETRLCLVGSGATVDNSSLRENLRAAGILDRTLLLGERSDVEDILPALDVLVSPSAYGEGFPNIIGEALGCGVPCVATDVGDSAWALGGHGILVPPGDSGALARGLLELHALGSAGREILGQNGRRYVEEHFTIGRIAREYASLYREMTGR